MTAQEKLSQYMLKQIESEDKQKLNKVDKKDVSFDNWENHYNEIQYLKDAELGTVGNYLTNLKGEVQQYGDIKDQLEEEGLLKNEMIKEIINSLEKQNKLLKESVVRLLFVQRLYSKSQAKADSIIRQEKKKRMSQLDKKQEEIEKQEKRVGEILSMGEDLKQMKEKVEEGVETIEKKIDKNKVVQHPTKKAPEPVQEEEDDDDFPSNVEKASIHTEIKEHKSIRNKPKIIESLENLTEEEIEQIKAFSKKGEATNYIQENFVPDKVVKSHAYNLARAIHDVLK